jgi:hypothetical protein
MCISEKVSWIALAIGLITTLFSIYFINNRKYSPLAITFIFVLLMQLVDALVWRNGCNKTGLVASRLALVFNLMQPIILYLAYVSIYPREGRFTVREILATIIVAFWIGYLIYKLNKDYGCVKTETCFHLDYKWWDDLNGYLYSFIVITLILLLVQPLKFGIAVSLFILLALLISIKYYNCGQASMWCLFVVIAPIFFIIFWKLFATKN